ncbi:hypothetical protein [Providencia sneebia]|uniref:hypothetical protein n=1 Tax=Providencia sneebia TaxID=516075 RepID=UPI00030B100A
MMTGTTCELFDEKLAGSQCETQSLLTAMAVFHQINNELSQSCESFWELAN